LTVGGGGASQREEPVKVDGGGGGMAVSDWVVVLLPLRGSKGERKKDIPRQGGCFGTKEC